MRYVLWLKVAPVQVVVEWQVVQSVGNPAAWWLGLVVPLYWVWWQATQVVGVPWYTPFTWHEAQAVAWCAPVSGNAVALWLKVAPVQVVVVWQVVQSVGNPAA